MFCLIHVGDGHLKINRPSFPELFIRSERTEMRADETRGSRSLLFRRTSTQTESRTLCRRCQHLVPICSVCLHAQYSGTSAFYRLLCQIPDCHLGFLTWNDTQSEQEGRQHRWEWKKQNWNGSKSKKLIKAPKRMQNPLLIQWILKFSSFLFIYTVVQMPS